MDAPQAPGGKAHTVLNFPINAAYPAVTAGLLTLWTIFFLKGGVDGFMPDFAQNIHSSRNMFSI